MTLSFKESCLASGLMAAALSATTSLAAPKPFTLDLGHAYVGWEIDHFAFSNTVGQFRVFDGDFLIDEERLENSLIRFVIQADSIDSNHVGRDNHLRAEDMLNVATYPTIKFVSTSIDMQSDDRGEITGDLTFMGSTQPFSVSYTHLTLPTICSV